jgi:hypothetical protein
MLQKAASRQTSLQYDESELTLANFPTKNEQYRNECAL